MIVYTKFLYLDVGVDVSPAPVIDTARAGREHVIRSGRVIHCLVPGILHSSSRPFLLHTNRERAEITSDQANNSHYDASMECDV